MCVDTFCQMNEKPNKISVPTVFISMRVYGIKKKKNVDNIVNILVLP